MKLFLIVVVLMIGTWYSVRVYFKRSQKSSPKALNELGLDEVTFLHGLENLDVKHPVLAQLSDALQDSIYGGRGYVNTLIAAFIAKGHVIIQGPPGTGKTLLVKAFSQACDLTYNRIQCTPDLLPQDVLGNEVLQRGDEKLSYNRGPIFSQVVHVDEINRTTPKLQSAFLEAMQEGQITMFGNTYTLPQPFFLVATQNPYDAIGTYLLPYAQVDRFMVGITTSHLSMEKEIELMRDANSSKNVSIDKHVDTQSIIKISGQVEDMEVSDEILEYAVRCIQQLKTAGFPLSVRASKSVLSLAKSLAFMQGAKIVTRHDIQMALLPVIKHRIDYIAGRFVDIEKIFSLMIGSLQKDDIAG